MRSRVGVGMDICLTGGEVMGNVVRIDEDHLGKNDIIMCRAYE